MTRSRKKPTGNAPPRRTFGGEFSYIVFDRKHNYLILRVANSNLHKLYKVKRPNSPREILVFLGNYLSFEDVQFAATQHYKQMITGFKYAPTVILPKDDSNG